MTSRMRGMPRASRLAISALTAPRTRRPATGRAKGRSLASERSVDEEGAVSRVMILRGSELCAGIGRGRDAEKGERRLGRQTLRRGNEEAGGVMPRLRQEARIRTDGHDAREKQGRTHR